MEAAIQALNRVNLKSEEYIYILIYRKLVAPVHLQANLREIILSVGGLREPKAQVARAAHTLSVCKRRLAHKLLSLQQSTLHHN
jgi:hypothetical protein